MADAGAQPGAFPANDADVLHQAAEWFAVLNTDVVDDGDRTRWQRWLAADPRHQAAWQRVEALSARFEPPPHVDKRAAVQALRMVNGRRRALKTMTVLGVGGLSGWLAWRTEPWQDWTADYRTAVGERRDVTLADGTRVWLNTGTALAVAYDASVRRLELRSGEVLIESAPDHPSLGRPFEVVMAEGRARPLGTRFSLYRDGEGCRVSVFEGAVEIGSQAGGEVKVVPTGQQRRFDTHRIEDSRPIDAGAEAWTRGLLMAADMRLADFVAELSRHQRGSIACAPEVANLRLVGAFPLADREQIYLALERSLPVRVRRPVPWWVRIEPA